MLQKLLSDHFVSFNSPNIFHKLQIGMLHPTVQNDLHLSKVTSLHITLMEVLSTTNTLPLPLFCYALRHCLNNTHYFFENRLLLEVDHFTRHVLQCLCRQIDAFIDQQEQVAALGGAHLLDFAPQVVRMPEADQLNEYTLPRPLMGQSKIRNHDRIAQVEHFIFTC